MDFAVPAYELPAGRVTDWLMARQGNESGSRELYVGDGAFSHETYVHRVVSAPEVLNLLRHCGRDFQVADLRVPFEAKNAFNVIGVRVDFDVEKHALELEELYRTLTDGRVLSETRAALASKPLLAAAATNGCRPHDL